MKKVKIQPLGDRVLVKANEVAEQVKGGILIPDSAKEKPQEATVVALGTGKIDDDKLTEIVNKVFDLRPAAIIRDLDLRRPIYSQTASYGHFGRTDVELPWEKTDKAETLKKYI